MLVLQVYVSVYADGPTRVLRFADAKSTALLEAEQSILDLAARLKQVRASTALTPVHRTANADLHSEMYMSMLSEDKSLLMAFVYKYIFYAN